MSNISHKQYYQTVEPLPDNIYFFIHNIITPQRVIKPSTGTTNKSIQTTVQLPYNLCDTIQLNELDRYCTIAQQSQLPGTYYITSNVQCTIQPNQSCDRYDIEYELLSQYDMLYSSENIYKHAQTSNNMRKNRYSNVLPHSNTRVQLLHNNNVHDISSGNNHSNSRTRGINTSNVYTTISSVYCIID